MREEGTPATLSELMGNKTNSSSYTLSDLPELLGGAMPEMEFSKVGRIRLLSALRNRFGETYMNIPGVKDIIDDFDKEIVAKDLMDQNRSR